MKKLFTILVMFTAMNVNAQWIELETQNSLALTSISAVNDNLIWTIPYTGKVLKSTNGGLNWTSYAFNTSEIPSGHRFNNIFALDGSTAFISGQSYGVNSVASFKTTNGGVNWFQIFSITNYYDYINAIWMKNSNEGILTNDPLNNTWTIRKTTNGGINWFTSINIPAETGEYGITNAMYSTGDNVWIGTTHGRIFHSSNFGTSWDIQNLNSIHEIGAIYFINSLTGICAGNTILSYTVNSGANWVPISYPNSNTSVGIAGGLNDFIIGNYGRKIYRTTNLGNTWTLEYQLDSGLQRINMTISRTGGMIWDARSNGKVGKRTTPMTIHTISSETPSKYSLSQNYPNPFNPMCNVQFSMCNAGNVKLVVYDVQGREVQTLVNEYMKPGTYEVSFDGSRLNSGVYFYKLITDGFTETKKMLMIK